MLAGFNNGGHLPYCEPCDPFFLPANEVVLVPEVNREEQDSKSPTNHKEQLDQKEIQTSANSAASCDPMFMGGDSSQDNLDQEDSQASTNSVESCESMVMSCESMVMGGVPSKDHLDQEDIQASTNSGATCDSMVMDIGDSLNERADQDMQSSTGSLASFHSFDYEDSQPMTEHFFHDLTMGAGESSSSCFDEDDVMFDKSTLEYIMEAIRELNVHRPFIMGVRREQIELYLNGKYPSLNLQTGTVQQNLWRAVFNGKLNKDKHHRYEISNIALSPFKRSSKPSENTDTKKRRMN